MSASIKKLLDARKARDNKAPGKLMEFNTNLPPVKAGSKNSNGPKHGSSKASVPANRNSNTNKSGKVSKATPVNNPKQVVQSSKKSSRINYRQLKSSK